VSHPHLQPRSWSLDLPYLWLHVLVIFLFHAGSDQILEATVCYKVQYFQLRGSFRPAIYEQRASIPCCCVYS